MPTCSTGAVGTGCHGSRCLLVEQTPEPAPRPRVDMSAALRALSPDELMALEGIVSKLESSAKAEARLDADGDDGPRRRRAHFRATADVEAVELTAEANLSSTGKLNPGEVEPSAEADGAVSSRDETSGEVGQGPVLLT